MPKGLLWFRRERTEDFETDRAAALAECSLEAVLIGNAAAALQGALETGPCWTSSKGLFVKKASKRRRALIALRKETDRPLTEQIRRLLTLPMNKRTHFLRVRLPWGGSAL